jgi:hypothetical protein
MPEDYREPVGIHLTRNPGAVAVWITRSYRPFPVSASHGGGMLFTFDDPEEVLWFREGQPATRDEVMTALTSGLSALEESARLDGPDQIEELHKQFDAVLAYLPNATTGAQFHYQRRSTP